MADTWNTSEMRQALGNGQDASLANGVNGTNGVNESNVATANDGTVATNAAENDIPGWVDAHPEQQFTADSAPTWDGNARVYQWDDEFGDVGPKFEDLERELFGDPTDLAARTGLDFSKYAITVSNSDENY